MIPSAQKAAFRLRPTIVNADIDPFYIEELSAWKFEVDIVSIGTGCETLWEARPPRKVWASSLAEIASGPRVASSGLSFPR